MRPTRRLRVFIGEDERYRGRPLFEAIVLEARERDMAGATVFKGFMGYAPHSDISTAGVLRLAENLPIVVEIVDEDERIEAFVPFLREAVTNGLVISSDVEAEQVLPGVDEAQGMALHSATRARIYLRDSATVEERPAYALIVDAFRDAGIDDISVHRGIMGYDPASGIVSARPLRFHTDLPVVVEAVAPRARIDAALPGVREVLGRGLITMSDVELYSAD